ncbi:carbonic anhydrase 1-like [Sycon ciliatum]|eukprot:scpid82357/ scgid14644/ Carbonic anhydrase 1; Carbonate dehydratase I; Carbonic anhydrase I
MELLVLLSLAITTTFAFDPSQQTWSYISSSNIGPASWGTLSGFETCGTGTEQSPINIPTASTDYQSYPPLNVTDSSSSAYFHFENNGAAAEADPEGTTVVYLTGGPLGSERYRIQNFHIHFGNSTFAASEHAVDGSRTAGELHVVFFKATYPNIADALASGDRDALAVIGMLFDVGSDASLAHPGLTTMLNHFSNLTYPGFSVVQSLDFATLLRPSDLTSFYTYEGSLTTPGCNEQVVWLVLSQVQYVLPASLDALSGLLCTSPTQTPAIPVFGNARPLQSLDVRRIFRNFQATTSGPNTTSSAPGQLKVSLFALFISVLAVCTHWM